VIIIFLTRGNMNYYKGRIYTFKKLKQDLSFIIKNISDYRKAFKNKNIGRSFAEKIMLVITAVNDCRYCSWFHAKQAAMSGISNDEIKKMLNLQFHAESSDYEIPALLFAQNYAETDRNPDKELLDRLINFYGEHTAADIILYIRAIYIGNLTGNTFDAFLARFKGQKAENSNILFELILFLICFPVLLPLSFIIKKKFQMSSN
jgi:AhpD family alkylhydroperoxidase